MNKNCDISINEDKWKIELLVGDYKLSLPNIESNKKAIIIIAKEFKTEIDSKWGITYQEISTNLGHKDRQWSNNVYREFKIEYNSDILRYLKRDTKLEEKSFELIEAQILSNLLVFNLSEQYKEFKKNNKDIKLSEKTFKKYVGEIDSKKILLRLKKVIKKDKITVNMQYYLEKFLNISKLSNLNKKEIIRMKSLKSEREPKTGKSPNLNLKTIEKQILVVFLYASGLTMETIGILFNISKSSIHNWVYSLCTIDIEKIIISKIKYWSGKISVDDKWDLEFCNKCSRCN